ncbi:hypothetical protein [Bacteroides helcogenes]|uniref:Uncharacterized protein n=1 Tax=Bacteroides helcogenes (strain ATCC 35417 / DSM 20613 / JCM 6297 / CCUG 15421 / P 36-108) TaxID=693979 RepID=E6SUB8_BACT6|nr:hypothetical protein [Bacteroides helcogenes]ADV42336.1 hypothetical protein Bache_0307 [Bacteroides helcogenes P 36-108]MDY5237208.1 hypothetical protein [Bacteroides helcogenes]
MEIGVKDRVKALLSGKKLLSRIKVVDRLFDKGTGLEAKRTVSDETYFDADGSGDITVEVIYDKSQIEQ